MDYGNKIKNAKLTYPTADFQPPTGINIDFVAGIDRKNTNYIN